MQRKRWLFAAILPSLLLVLIIAIYPIGYAFYLSLTDKIAARPVTHFIGLGNYIKNLTSPQFWTYVKTTAVFVFASVGLELLIGFGLAILLNQGIRGRTFFRVIILIPLMIPPVTAALMWKVMLEASTGPVNHLLSMIGIDGPAWLAERATALPSVIAIDVWVYTPFVALLLLAGLQSIPQTMYEAAAVDGARTWKTFRMVTLPMVKPVIWLVLLFRFALALNSADTIFVTTMGGPNVATTTLNFAAFHNLFPYLRFGYAASLGITVFAIIFVTTQILINKTRHMWRGA
jgi:multiple sugar transport system permease protein